MNLLEQNMLLVGVITILAVISPGPDFAVILRNGLRYGRRPGLATALGIAAGVVIHITYTLLGLSYIVAQYAWLLEIVRYAGAGYLIWLGISAFIPSQEQEIKQDSATKGSSISYWKAFRHGFFCNALNPKTMLFFLALFTQVISPQTSTAVKVGVGIFISLTHLFWFVLIVFALTNHRTETIVERWRNGLEKTAGVCLLGLGTKLAVDA